jgi:hypothetical protein
VHLFSILSEAYDKVQDKPTEVFVLQQDESNDSSPAPPPEMMPPPQLPSHATKPRQEVIKALHLKKLHSLFSLDFATAIVQ